MVLRRLRVPRPVQANKKKIMNQFANLSAESEISNLATVGVGEVFAAEVFAADDSAAGVCASRIATANATLAKFPARFARRAVVGAVAALHAAISAEAGATIAAASCREEAAWAALSH